jgi:hypothetical protein
MGVFHGKYKKQQIISEDCNDRASQEALERGFGLIVG